MKISVDKNRVISLLIKAADPDLSESGSVIPHNNDASFNYDIKFTENNFFVTFVIHLVTKEGSIIDLQYETQFSCSKKIDDNFKNARFPHINGPAISYPFVRAYISTITVNSGMMPILLPSINFINLYNDKLEAESNREG